MSRAVACALAALTVACSGPQLKEHVADLSKNLPATLEAERPKEGDPRTVTIRVYADPAVRALPKWRDELTDQIDYASQLLTPLLGVKLQVEKVNDWARTGDPSAALAQLRDLDKGDGVTWVLGVIAPNDSATKVISELGAGEPLGHHVILRSWAETPETAALAATLPDLKDAERGELINAHRRHKQTVVLVHMLAATLGAIAETDPQWLQNPTYSPKQSGFSERNRELMQLAIDERVSDGSEEAIAKKVLEAIEKSEWGGWVAADKEQVETWLRNVIDSKRAGKTATDIPAAAHDQITRIDQLAKLGQVAEQTLHVLRPQAGLHVRQPRASWVLRAQQVGQQRLHAAAGEQRRRIVAQHKRRPVDDHVIVLGKHREVRAADLVGFHRRKPAIEDPRQEGPNRQAMRGARRP